MSRDKILLSASIILAFQVCEMVTAAPAPGPRLSRWPELWTTAIGKFDG